MMICEEKKSSPPLLSCSTRPSMIFLRITRQAAEPFHVLRETEEIDDTGVAKRDLLDRGRIGRRPRGHDRRQPTGEDVMLPCDRCHVPPLPGGRMLQGHF